MSDETDPTPANYDDSGEMPDALDGAEGFGFLLMVLCGAGLSAIFILLIISFYLVVTK